ncbi:MAG: toll/interleukin-1 receptor domain-containing protein [Deltaproteobacteria bacterium]|nr:toll/interleukin-1 receptor domain-containing protein [Deltaproteobacteria bacterium]
MSIEILSNIAVAVAASIAAASTISVVKEWLNRKMKTKLKIGGIEIEISDKSESMILNQISETVKNLKIHPKVFIIYPHTQKQFVKKLADDLSQSGINIWLDENELKPGDSIKPKIEKALKESQWVILVPTPEDRGSSWVYKEIDLVFKERMWADFSNDYESGLKSLLKGIIRVPEQISAKDLEASNKANAADAKSRAAD